MEFLEHIKLKTECFFKKNYVGQVLFVLLSKSYKLQITVAKKQTKTYNYDKIKLVCEFSIVDACFPALQKVIDVLQSQLANTRFLLL